MTLIYNILWTSPDFPSARVYPLDHEEMVTNDYIYVFELTERFLPIGPAYDMYINTSFSI